MKETVRWTCSDCGEIVPSNFELCWNCMATKDGEPCPDAANDAEPDLAQSDSAPDDGIRHWTYEPVLWLSIVINLPLILFGFTTGAAILNILALHHTTSKPRRGLFWFAAAVTSGIACVSLGMLATGFMIPPTVPALFLGAAVLNLLLLAWSCLASTRKCQFSMLQLAVCVLFVSVFFGVARWTMSFTLFYLNLAHSFDGVVQYAAFVLTLLIVGVCFHFEGRERQMN